VAERIASVEAQLVRVPVEPPRGDAIQKFTALELPIVRVTDDAGRVGVGFGYTIGTGGTAVLALLREHLLPWLEGQDPRRIAALGDHLQRGIHALTPGCLSSTALAAVDIALWDLAGHRTATPVWVLLGGARDRVPVYNTDVGWLDRPLDELLEVSRRAVRREGFRAVKLKVGKPDPEEDRERVARVRESLGERIGLMIDANQSWALDEAIGRLRMLEPYRLLWIEEPLPATDLEGYRTLGRHTSIPRAGGESLYEVSLFYEALRHDALDILQPDVVRVGGISQAMAVGHLAAAAGRRVATHVSPELSVSVGAALPGCMFVEYVPQMEPVLSRPSRIEDGAIVPPSGPGHGVEFDGAALRRFEVGRPARQAA
jgi:L-alanine-DL-glutamate epimerase-like enolase superfamily enzyme